MKTIIKVILYTISGLLAITLGLILILWLNSPGKAEPIIDQNGNEIAGSISTIEKIILGGQEQYLIIRGTDASKPIMLFLHGGPGSPETAFMKHYNKAIEDDFVMVYWEQRGAGKSYSNDISPESMNMEQFISDTRELSEYLIKRFKQEKIYIMGHSWGSLLGILTAYRHPELYRAYFGIGQVAHQYRGEKISYDWVVAQANARGNKKAMKTLSGMSFPDSLANSKEWINFLFSERNYVTQFEGSFRGMTSMWPMIKMVLNTKEYKLSDKFNYARGNLFSLENLWNEVINTNLLIEIDSMQIPVYIFQGIHDYQTPYSVAEDFYKQLKAPQKEFFTFENSAHSPVFEEVEKFNEIVYQITH